MKIGDANGVSKQAAQTLHTLGFTLDGLHETVKTAAVQSRV